MEFPFITVISLSTRYQQTLYKTLHRLVVGRTFKTLQVQGGKRTDNRLLNDTSKDMSKLGCDKEQISLKSLKYRKPNLLISSILESLLSVLLLNTIQCLCHYTPEGKAASQEPTNKKLIQCRSSREISVTSSQD